MPGFAGGPNQKYDLAHKRGKNKGRHPRQHAGRPVARGRQAVLGPGRTIPPRGIPSISVLEKGTKRGLDRSPAAATRGRAMIEDRRLNRRPPVDHFRRKYAPEASLPFNGRRPVRKVKPPQQRRSGSLRH